PRLIATDRQFAAADAEIISACADPCPPSAALAILILDRRDMMTLNTDGGATPTYPHAADLSILLPSLEALVDEIVASGLSRDMLGRALDAGMTEVTSVLRAVPAAEGRLLEHG